MTNTPLAQRFHVRQSTGPNATTIIAHDEDTVVSVARNGKGHALSPGVTLTVAKDDGTTLAVDLNRSEASILAAGTQYATAVVMSTVHQSRQYHARTVLGWVADEWLTAPKGTADELRAALEEAIAAVEARARVAEAFPGYQYPGAKLSAATPPPPSPDTLDDQDA